MPDATLGLLPSESAWLMLIHPCNAVHGRSTPKPVCVFSRRRATGTVFSAGRLLTAAACWHTKNTTTVKALETLATMPRSRLIPCSKACKNGAIIAEAGAWITVGPPRHLTRANPIPAGCQSIRLRAFLQSFLRQKALTTLPPHFGTTF